MKDFFKLLLAFSPWLAFLFISGHSLIRLDVGIIVAAILTVVLAVYKIHRGFLMWGGILFFSLAMVFVIGLKNSWFIHHLGVLATGTLFVATQLSMVFGHPFTAIYARENVPQEHWNSGEFVAATYTTTAVWASIFFVNLMIDIIQLGSASTPEWYFKTAQYSVLVLGILFTTLYSRMMQKKRSAQIGKVNPNSAV